MFHLCNVDDPQNPTLCTIRPDHFTTKEAQRLGDQLKVAVKKVAANAYQNYDRSEEHLGKTCADEW